MRRTIAECPTHWPRMLAPTFSVMLIRDFAIRCAVSVLWAFALFTVVWVVWGFYTPGDFFANGSTFLRPTLAAGVLIGLLTGFRRGLRWHAFVLAVAVACLCFWIFVPEGWWAHEPR